MQVRYFKGIACAAIAAWLLTAGEAQSQTRSGGVARGDTETGGTLQQGTGMLPPRLGSTTHPGMSGSTLGSSSSSVDASVTTPTTPRSPSTGMKPGVPGVTQTIPGRGFGQTVVQGAGQGQLIRGRDLIGMNIWGANRQQIGSVRDFIVDYTSGTPSLYFAVAPLGTGWSGQYVIVPFTALQVGATRPGAHYFTLAMSPENLRLAPRLSVDRWNTLHDRQLLTTVSQFYQPFERTAARPGAGTTFDGTTVTPGQTGIQGQTQVQGQTRTQRQAGTQGLADPRLDSSGTRQQDMSSGDASQSGTRRSTDATRNDTTGTDTSGATRSPGTSGATGTTRSGTTGAGTSGTTGTGTSGTTGAGASGTSGATGAGTSGATGTGTPAADTPGTTGSPATGAGGSTGGAAGTTGGASGGAGGSGGGASGRGGS